MTRLLISGGFWISGRHDLPSDAKSIFFDLFRNVKLFLVAQQVRLLGPLLLSKVSQDLNNQAIFVQSVNVMFSCNVVSRWAQLVSFVCKSIFFDLFWGQNKATSGF